MKFDKETVIVLVVAAAILFGWMYFYPQYQADKSEKQARMEQERKANEAARNQQTLPAAPAVPAAVTPPVAPAAPAVPAAPVTTPAAPAVPAVDLTKAVIPAAELENELVKLTFDPLKGVLTKVELKNYRKGIDGEEPLIFAPDGNEYRTFQTNLFSGMPVKVPEVKVDGNVLTIRRTLPEVNTIQTFTLQPDSFRLNMAYTIVNHTANDRIVPELVIWAAGMPPMPYLSTDKVNSIRHNLDYCLAVKNTVKSIEPDPKKPEDLTEEETTEAVAWIGATNKYFASLLFPENFTFNNGLKFSQTVGNAGGNTYALPSVGGSIKNLPLPAGASVTHNFQYYCGPKEINRIKELPESAMDAMHIAYWSWFEFIARPLARFLVFLYGLVGNYGIAIILLTIIVRAVFWPVTQKANNSMRKMQKIQPKLKELREKYKDNPQELNMRMMELYRTEKVNPLGGCLPMLLQLPIFFALYSVFDSAVELRHVSFLWAKDLAQPDQVGPVLHLLGFDLAIHPWIIMMTILMVVQQKMTPSQADPTQQKIMMAMPVIMLVMLYWLPSGLTLYWTVSQLFSIIQLKYGQYLAAKEEAQEKAAAAKSTK